MTSESRKVFTFAHAETGHWWPVIAEHEAAARLQLGESWHLSPLAFPPSELSNLAKLVETTRADEIAAHKSMQAANPMGKTKITSAEALAEFTALQKKYEMQKVLRQELERLDIAN
jgi:hypothetical protein